MADPDELEREAQEEESNAAQKAERMREAANEIRSGEEKAQAAKERSGGIF